MTLADDLQLQQRVLDELAFDPKIHAAHIGVTARDGVVTLGGHVRTVVEKFSAERAARKILAACAKGQPALIMPWPAYLMIAANALFPNLTGYAMKIVNVFLPSSIERAESDVRPDAGIHRTP